MRRLCAISCTLIMLLVIVDVLAQPAPAVPAAVKAPVKVEGTLTVVQPAGVTAPAAAPVVPAAPPATVGEAVEQAKTGIAFAKAKNWWGVSAVAIFIVMFVLKLTPLYDKVGKRASYIIVGVLSVVAMLLAKFAGGVSWEAVWIVLTSGPMMASLNDLWKRGILGKEMETPIKPAAPTPPTA